MVVSVGQSKKTVGGHECGPAGDRPQVGGIVVVNCWEDKIGGSNYTGQVVIADSTAAKLASSHRLHQATIRFISPD